LCACQFANTDLLLVILYNGGWVRSWKKSP